MGAHFPAVELDNAVQFSTLSRMSGFLWLSSTWACRFGRFLQYTSGIDVLPCSLDTDVNYETTMLQLHPFYGNTIKQCNVKIIKLLFYSFIKGIMHIQIIF